MKKPDRYWRSRRWRSFLNDPSSQSCRRGLITRAFLVCRIGQILKVVRTTNSKILQGRHMNVDDWADNSRLWAWFWPISASQLPKPSALTPPNHTTKTTLTLSLFPRGFDWPGRPPASPLKTQSVIWVISVFPWHFFHAFPYTSTIPSTI